MMDLYDRDGQPLPDDYLDEKHKGKYRWKTQQRVANTNLTTDAGSFTVSTVWLAGIDHGHDGGPPVLFETMVFGDKWDQQLERYCTEEDAMRGHIYVLDRLRDGLAPFERLEDE